MEPRCPECPECPDTSECGDLRRSELGPLLRFLGLGSATGCCSSDGLSTATAWIEVDLKTPFPYAFYMLSMCLLYALLSKRQSACQCPKSAQRAKTPSDASSASKTVADARLRKYLKPSAAHFFEAPVLRARRDAPVLQNRRVLQKDLGDQSFGSRKH